MIITTVRDKSVISGALVKDESGNLVAGSDDIMLLVDINGTVYRLMPTKRLANWKKRKE